MKRKTNQRNMLDTADNYKKGSDWIRENEDNYGNLSVIVELLLCTLKNVNNISQCTKNLLEAVENENNNKSSFRVGDLVKIAATESQLRERQAVLNPGCIPSLCDVIKEIGKVVSVDNTNGKIYVKYEKLDEKLPLNPDVLEKLSNFSVDQIVRIRDDEHTLKKLQTKLGNRVTHLIVGQVGCVMSNVDDGKNVSLEWLDTSISELVTKVQSDWVEPLPVSKSQLYKLLFKMRWELADHFLEVAYKGELYLVQLLVQYYKVPVDVQHRSRPGSTALHLACIEGRLNVIEWFLSEPKNKELLLEKEDYKGRRAIYFAVKNCQPEALNMLIKNGADVDPQTSKGRKSPLHKAVIKKNLECVVLLIENYCNVNLQDLDGNTPLHYLVSENSSQVSDDVFKALVKSGRFDFNIRNVKGHTVFHSAVWAGNLSAVSSLLEMENGKIALERVSETGSNALHLACTKGNFQVAKLLLKKKELINESNKSGQTPLMVACLKGFDSLIELLVKAGTDVNAVDEKCNSAISLMIQKIYLDDHHCESKTKKTTTIPNPEESPEIYKIYDELSGLPCYKETMEKHPSVASVCYLIKHGGDLDSGRYWISKFRNVNLKVILEGFLTEWQISVDKEQLIVMCILCNKPASRMRFVCCGNEGCLFCFECRTKYVRRCPCCNNLIKPNEEPLPIIELDDGDTVKENEDSDSSFDHHQPSDIGNSHPVIKPSESEALERPSVIPVKASEEPNLPVIYISSPLRSSSVEPFSPKWELKEKASRKGTDLLEDGLGNYYTRRSANVWQCTRQSNKQRNKCPATVRNVGGQYVLSKSHQHSTQSPIIARSYMNACQILN